MIRRPNHIGTLVLTRDWGTRTDRLDDFQLLVCELEGRCIPHILPAAFRPFQISNGFDDNFDEEYVGSASWRYQTEAMIHACGKMIVFTHDGWRDSAWLKWEIDLCIQHSYQIYYAKIDNDMVSIYRDSDCATDPIG